MRFRVAGLVASSLVLTWSLSAHPGSGIAVDEQGRVYFTAGPAIVLVEPGKPGRIIIHDESHERFYQLHHIQVAPEGGFLTASDLGDAIWRFDVQGELTRFYPPSQSDRALRVGSGGDPFAVDREGNVFAVNSQQDRFTQILKVSSEGRVSVLAGGDWGFADGRGSEGKFGDLHGGSMLVLPDGVLLVTDHQARVRRVTPHGVVSTLAGGRDRGYADGPGTEARFDGACGLAVDGQGNVLVVEQAGRVRKISPDGLVTTVAGSSRSGSRDGALLAASFDSPTGIAVAPNGDLFVLEPSGPRIRRISHGYVETIHRGLP